MPGVPEKGRRKKGAAPAKESRLFARLMSFAVERTANLTEAEEAPARRRRRAIAAEGVSAVPTVEAVAGAPAQVGTLPESFWKDRVEEFRRRRNTEVTERTEAMVRAVRGVAPMPIIPPPAVNWIPIGPSVARRGQAANRPAVSGRVSGFAISAGGARVYAATADGGVWRSDDLGVNWRSTMDDWDLNPAQVGATSLSCGAIGIHPTNADRVYVGTGEGNTFIVFAPSGTAQTAFYGVGMLRTDNGGTTWVTESVASGSPDLAGRAVWAMAVDPNDGERVVAATTAGLYRREPDGSGGFHWARKQTGFFTDVVVARSGSVTRFYAAQQAVGVMTSTDGHTWTSVNTGFPTTNVGRIDLGIQPTNTDVVYAMIALPSNAGAANRFRLQGVWRFDTALASSWRQVSGAPPDVLGGVDTFGNSLGQGFYDIVIHPDPNNINRVYLGGSTALSGGQWSGSLYRCVVTVSGSGAGTTYSMTPTFIGGNVHADIHAIDNIPGDSDRLFIGCDGGAYYSENATGAATFVERNTGLQCFTMNQIGLHPTQDAVMFCGSQDNGTLRYTGEECWLHSGPGDGGYAVVNWNDPYRVLRTYVTSVIYRATDGGVDYASWSNVSLSDNALFYAPLEGAPQSGTAADANIAAFGGNRLWLTTNFGTSWESLPANAASDSLGTAGGQFVLIRSIAISSPNLIFAGTNNGQVHRYRRTGGTWSRTAINPPLSGAPVTDIVVDPADATGESIYITFGGSGDYRHVWRYNGSSWTQRSGPSAGSADALMDVQFNAVTVDPANTAHVYAGADIGVWRSTDSGGTWAPFSDGLPDAPVMDLKINNARRLLWAATHGRGVFEYQFDPATAAGVELYIRDTQLDRGRYNTVNGLPNPVAMGGFVAHWAGPDIKVDPPSFSGTYQTPTTQISFYEFTDRIADGSGNVATVDASAGIAHNRVYLQIHNRGVTVADNVQVMLLLANASGGLPNLPAGYTADVTAGTPISAPNWQTVGIQTVSGLKVGFPKILHFDLPSNMLPPPSSLPGQQHYCLLALLHHADDPFTNTQVVVDSLSPNERKAAHKNLQVVHFTGTLPPATIVWNLLWIHGTGAERLTHLTLQNIGKAGRVRIVLPDQLRFDRSAQSLLNLKPIESPDLRSYIEKHVASLKRLATAGLSPREECDRMAAALKLLNGRPGYFIAAPGKASSILNVQVPAEGSYGVLIGIERPQEMQLGDAWKLLVAESDPETRETRGGSVYEIAFVRSPETRLDLKIAARKSGLTRILVAVTVSSDGRTLTDADGVEVQVAIAGGNPQAAAYSATARAFQVKVRTPARVSRRVRVTASAKQGDTVVRETADVLVTS